MGVVGIICRSSKFWGPNHIFKMHEARYFTFRVHCKLILTSTTACVIISSRRNYLGSCDHFKFWEITNDISEMVQNINSYRLRCNERLFANRRGLSKGTNTNHFEWRWRSLLLFETFLSHIPREIQRVLSTICLHMNQKVYVICNFNCLRETNRILNVTGSHLHYNFFNSLKRYKIKIWNVSSIRNSCGLTNSGTFDDLERPSRSLAYCKPFNAIFRWPLPCAAVVRISSDIMRRVVPRR